MTTAKSAWNLIKQTFANWSDDKVPRLAGSLAYYTIVSLAPLLILAIAMAGAFFGKEAASGAVVSQFQGFVGQDGARGVEALLKNADQPTKGLISSIIAGVILIFAASGVFGELQDALNTIWKVRPKPGRGILGMIRDRFISFSMVLGIGFLLLVSLLLSALISGVSAYMGGDSLAWMWQIINQVVSFAVAMALFAMIYKVLPDVRIAWRDVWIGAVATAVLFTLGKYLIGLYLGRSTTASVFGAAGSAVAILIWVYYSAQVMFLGAEFTQVYARRHAQVPVPTDNAELVSEYAAKNAANTLRPAPPMPAPRPVVVWHEKEKSTAWKSGLLLAGGWVVGRLMGWHKPVACSAAQRSPAEQTAINGAIRHRAKQMLNWRDKQILGRMHWQRDRLRRQTASMRDA